MEKLVRGRFITIEGTDGAGKTTQIAGIRQFLESEGIECVVTREPGGTPMGEAIRNLLLERSQLGATPATELLLVFAARAQHLAEVIEPALDRGAWVICDRFTDATYAYQGGGGGLSFDAISRIEDWVQGSLRPDLTLLFDVTVEVGLQRSRASGGGADRFERMDLAAKERIRSTYLELTKRFPERIQVVDANSSPETVSQQVRDILRSCLKNWVGR
jgi:dTMP kinase